MARIHELIPAETDKTTIANTIVEEAITTFAKKPDHFLGQTRVVTMYDETRQADVRLTRMHDR